MRRACCWAIEYRLYDAADISYRERGVRGARELGLDVLRDLLGLDDLLQQRRRPMAS